MHNVQMYRPHRWQHYDAGLDYVCSRNQVVSAITVTITDTQAGVTNGTAAPSSSTGIPDAAQGIPHDDAQTGEVASEGGQDAADPLSVYLANEKKARAELQARLDAIDWQPYEQVSVRQWNQLFRP
jgi:hypothetical protein